MTTDDELTRVTIGKPSQERGFTIPRPPKGHPLHELPRAGYVGDDRPLACRLADPRTPKDEGCRG